MTIDVKRDGEKAIVTVAGRLDTTTAPALEKIINEEIEGVTNLVLELSGLVYISSAGLRVLLGAQKKMQKLGTMKLVGVGESVMEVLEMTGFADILVIE